MSNSALAESAIGDEKSQSPGGKHKSAIGNRQLAMEIVSAQNRQWVREEMS